MPSDQLAVVGHHAGNGPAELGHARGDLGDLVCAVDFGIAGIRAQPVNRPRLNLARREDEVHRGSSHLRQGGRADACGQHGQRQDRGPRCGGNENARDGIPAGAILR